MNVADFDDLIVFTDLSVTVKFCEIKEKYIFSVKREWNWYFYGLYLKLPLIFIEFLNRSLKFRKILINLGHFNMNI